MLTPRKKPPIQIANNQMITLGNKFILGSLLQRTSKSKDAQYEQCDSNA